MAENDRRGSDKGRNNYEKGRKVPFEEAINQTGFGLYNYILTALAGLCIIAYVCIVFASTIIVPTSACELRTTESQKGLLAASPLVGAIIGAILWGYLGDRNGRRKMLLLALISGSLLNACASLSVNWVMLLVVQFCATLLSAGQYTLPVTLLSESVPMVRRNLVLLLVTSIFLLAQGIMALMAIPIIPLPFSIYLSALNIYFNSWRLVVLVYSTPGLICALWLYFMQESPKFLLATGDEEGALKVLRVIYKMNNGKAKEDYQVKGLLTEMSANEPKLSTKDQIIPLFKKPLLKYLAIMTTLSVFLQTTSFMVWLPNIANKFVGLLGTDEGADYNLCKIINVADQQLPDANCSLNSTALVIVFCVGAIQSVINFFMSLIINRVGRRNMVIAIGIVCGCSGIAANWVPNAIGSAAMFIVFLLAMLLMGLYTAITVALFPTHLRALAVSLTMSGGRIAMFAVIQLLNYLLLNDCETGFYIFGSLLVVSAGVAAFLPDDRFLGKPKPVDNPEESTSKSERM